VSRSATAPPGEGFFLVRHGAAERQAPGGGGDAARRLTEAGREEFAASARALAAAHRIVRIVTSPHARARETALLLAAASGAPVEQAKALASGASSGADLLALGRSLGAGVALVGHNPELAEAIALAGGAAGEVPPGTVAAIGLDGRLRWVRSRW
jgi:phosphohistidine phosphatase